MPGKPALIAEGVGYVLDSDVSRIRKQRPEADAGISGDGAMRGHTTQKITPDTLGTIPHPLLFLISGRPKGGVSGDRKSTRLNSSHLGISYAVFCLKKI